MLTAYRWGLGEQSVDPGDAPHALEVLLRLNGDRAQRSAELPSCHRHLDAGLRRGRDGGALRHARRPVSLPQWQQRVDRWWNSGQRCDAGGGQSEPGGLREIGGGG